MIVSRDVFSMEFRHWGAHLGCQLGPMSSTMHRKGSTGRWADMTSTAMQKLEMGHFWALV